jgi:hypothetical protein
LKTKTCAGCGKRKPLTEYHRAQRTRDGLCRRCKTCCAEIRRQRYLKNREQVLEQQRRYYAENKEEICAANKKYQKKHRKHTREYARAYYWRNREKRLEYGRKYRVTKKLALAEPGN